MARHYIDLQRINGRSVDEVRANQRQFQHKVLNLQIDLERRLGSPRVDLSRSRTA
jgi:hypothetical protein